MRVGLLFWALSCLVFTRTTFAEEGIEHLDRVAKTYSHLKSFQVEAIAELPQRCRIAPYQCLSEWHCISVRPTKPELR